MNSRSPAFPFSQGCQLNLEVTSVCLHKSCTICCLCKNRLARHNCETTCDFYSCNTQTNLDPFSFPCKRRLEGNRPKWSSPRWRLQSLLQQCAYYQVLVYQVKNSHPSSLFYFRTRAADGMFTRDTLTLTAHQENRLSIGEEVSFRATPKPTPAAENKARIPGGKRAPDTAWVSPTRRSVGGVHIVATYSSGVKNWFRISNCNS